MSVRGKDPASELSRRMLSGWTLLGDTCTQGCNVPLVENKRQKIIECVNCGTHFNRDADKMIPIPNSAPSNANKEVAAASVPAQSPSKPTEVKQEQQHNEDMMEDEEEDLLPPPLTAEELAQMEERRKRNDRTSKIMGEKLLAGWTMLSDVCPKPDCYQPLMRDSQKQMWCLGCNTMVIRQEDFDPTKHKLVNAGGDNNKLMDLTQSNNIIKPDPNSGNSGNSGINPISLPTSPMANPQPSSNKNNQPESPTDLKQQFYNLNNNSNIDARQRLYDKFTSPPPSSHSLSHTPHSHSHSHAHAVPSLNFHSAHSHQINPDNTSTSPQSPQSSVSYALSVLQVKVHDLSVLLAKTTHPEEIQVISAALKECGLALSALSRK